MNAVVKAILRSADVADRAGATIVKCLVLWSLTVPFCRAFDRLEPAAYQVIVPGVLRSGALLPKWTGSFLVSWMSNTPAGSEIENVSIFDKTGKLITSRRIWFADAVTVQIRDVAGSGNTVVAVGKALNGTGVYSGFLAFLPVQGSTVEVTQLGTFEPESVAVGDDQAVWVLGYELGEGRRIKTAPRHATLRRYTPKGQANGQYLYWPDKQCGLHQTAASDEGFPLVRTGAGRVGVLLPNCREWLELNPSSGQLMSTVALYPVSAQREKHFIWNVVILPGAVYAYVGQELFRLNVTSGSWDAVTITMPTEKPISILGIEGTFLVYITHGNVAWSKLIPH